MGSREQSRADRQSRAPCEAQGLRSSSCLSPGSEPAGPLDLAPELRHDELRIPAPLRARCPGTCDRATSPCPPGDLQSGHGPAGEQDGKEEPPGQQQPAGHPNESHSDNVPWYVRTIKEKEECLLTLVEEIDRLAKYKAECVQKDAVIANLLREVERLKKQLEWLKDSADTGADTKSKQGNSSEEANEASTLGAILEQAEAEKMALMAQLTAFQKAHEELFAELQKAEDDYNMATGTMFSLQRQLEIQESQLRRTKSENERLQKEITGRENQLQAMSAKFGSLREERKHEEMMAAMEKENSSLRQVVREQKSKLDEQMELISDLQGTAWQLQAEALTNQFHMQKQQCAQEEMKSQAEVLQHTELQTRVALERITSKFERFRSKIIQATFSTAGIKAPQAELTDEEVLEAMQKIINERIEFYQMLKQKGIKVPSLTNIDTFTSSASSAKGRR
uniref:Coiled-coil domain containing 27 n=2 Tax=Gallus gallus TaxID=9031 RepID=A0A1L1RNL0_CHICK